jgi:hypothetical protein
MWAGIGLLRRSVIGGIAIVGLTLSLLIVVNAGGSTGAEASLETGSGVATSNSKSSNSPNSASSASDGESAPSDGQIQSNSDGSKSAAPNGTAAGSPSGAVPGQAPTGQQQTAPGSPGTSPTTTRPSGTTRPPTTNPPTTIACPTNRPSASGNITSLWQPPFNPNLPSSSQEYYVSGSVVVTNTANRPVDVDLNGYLRSPLNEWGWQFYPGTVTVGPNSSSTVGFSDIHVYANSSSDIWVSVNVSSFSFQC